MLHLENKSPKLLVPGKSGEAKRRSLHASRTTQHQSEPWKSQKCKNHGIHNAVFHVSYWSRPVLHEKYMLIQQLATKFPESVQMPGVQELQVVWFF